MKGWTPNELRHLVELYPDQSAKAIALVVGKSARAVYSKANALGLAKSAEYLSSTASGRIQRGRIDPRMVATQIKPGEVPWNKGVKGSTGTHPNCKATQFSKGRPAEEARNYAPIGTLRVSKDNYLERKVTDDPSVYPARRWVAVHRQVWEAAHGSIPARHIVTFKPGMKTIVLAEVTPDRLECITRAENARRNHPISKDPEFAKLVQLKSAIARQVNRITREAREAEGATT